MFNQKEIIKKKRLHEPFLSELDEIVISRCG